MSFKGKIERLKSIFYITRLKVLYGEAFIFGGDLLSSKIDIKISRGGSCCLKNVFAGAGKVVFRVLCEGAELDVGNDCCFNANVRIDCRKKIKIGDNVMFGPNVYIVDHDHDIKNDNWKDTFVEDDIVIEDNVWIGANVIILRGTKIGRNCVIGAGTILKGDYPANKIYYTERRIVTKSKNI